MKSKNTGAFVVCAVAIVLIVIILVVNGQNKNSVNNNQQLNTNQGQVVVQNQSTTESTEFVKKESDGTNTNTSSKLMEAKTIDGIKLTNIQLKEANGITTLTVDALNTTSSKLGEVTLLISFVDKSGNILARDIELDFIGIEPGSTAKGSAAITDNLVNAYDFTVTKK